MHILTCSFLDREAVSSDFMTACLFLKDHMDNMDNPNDDMVSSHDSSTSNFEQMFGFEWRYIISASFLVSRSCSQRKALVVLFQRWFSVAAEETSVASELTVYLREVKKATPSLLAFLVNLADDNGNTVLHYSVSHCNYSIVGLLLDTGNSVCCCP